MPRMRAYTSTCIKRYLPRGGFLPEKLGGGVRPASLNPYPIYDQNLQYSLTYYL